MKILHIILLFCFLLSANAQRRSSGTTQDTASEKPHQPVRSRGRARFTATPEYVEPSDTSKKSTSSSSDSTNSNRRVVARKRVNTKSNDTPTLERKARPTEIPKPVYEVQEVLNESPIDPYRRQSKPRILTESRFEVHNSNAPKRPLFEPSVSASPILEELPQIDDVYKDFGATARQFAGRKVPPRGDVVVDSNTGPVEFGNTARFIVSSRRGEVVPPRGASFVTPANDISFGSTARQILTSRGADPKPIPFGNPSRQPILTKTTQPPISEDFSGDTLVPGDAVPQQPNVQELDAPSEGLDTTVQSLPADLPSETPAKEINELRQGLPEPITESARKTQTGRRVNSGRSRVSQNPSHEPITQTSSLRTRGRTRGSRRQESEVEASTAPNRAISRSSRGRRPESATLESSRGQGPSVFAEEVGEISRSRTGRRITSSSSPEKFTIDLAASQIVSTRTRASSRRVPTTQSSVPANNSRRRGGSSRTSSATEESSTTRSNVRSRSREPQSRSHSKETTAPRGSSRDAHSRENLKNGAREIPTRTSSRFSLSPRDAAINEARNVETTIRSSHRTNFRDGPSSKTNLKAEVLTENDVRPAVVPQGRSREVPLRTNPITTENARGRSRFTENPPAIDEQKLEVLPLFESEDKIIDQGRKSRSRKDNSVEDSIQASATETDAKVATRPKKNNIEVQSKVTVTQSVEARTEASPTSVRTSKQRIKESVIQEVNEVTSKRKVSRARKPSSSVQDTKTKSKVSEKKVKGVSDAEVVASRGTKKSEVNLNIVGKKKNGSEEEIDDTDNYPEQFKALIKSKKGKKNKRYAVLMSPKKGEMLGRPLHISQQQTGSRPRLLPSEISSITKNNKAAEKVVIPTSSTVTRSTTDPPPAVVTRVTVKQDDIENELLPKQSTSTTPQTRASSSTRERLSITSKPDIPPKKKKYSRGTEPTRTTKKFSRSTVTPLTATSPTATSRTRQPTSREPHRFHARFTSSTTQKYSDLNATAPPSSAKGGRSFSPPPTRGLYSSKKERNEKRDDSVVRFTKKQAETVQVPKTASPPLKKSSRYSSRYRNDISARGVQQSKSTTSTPFYIPTIPTAAYVPTVPTITPPYTTVNGGKDKDLGLEVLTFDDPVNTIPSANLVNGELLTTDKALKISALVRDGTTEKPGSIIERIINSITAISTSTTAPNVSTLSTTTTSEASANSAILKLATKKSTTTKDKTRQDDDNNDTIPKTSSSPLTLTSEKPTTIIERILSSLTALQNVETNSIQVGNDFNTISSSSTTPLPKYSSKISSSTQLPAPFSSLSSTSLNPLNVLEEVGEEQLLQKRTIGKLLSILNGLTSTHPPEELVAITPKNMNTFTTNQVEQFATVYPSRNAITSAYKTSSPFPTTVTNLIEARGAFPTSETSLPLSTSTSGETLSTLSEQVTTFSSTTETEASTDTPVVTSTTEPTKITIFSRLNEVDSPTQSPNTQSTEVPSTSSTTTDIYSTFFTPPPTLPTLTKFEVSPGSVSIFSANELSNFVTPDDNVFNTVTIPSRANFDNTGSTTDNSVTTAEPSTTESSTIPSGTTDSLMITSTTEQEGSTVPSRDIEEYTTVFPALSMSVTDPSNQISANNNVSNSKVNFVNRAGRLLNIVEDPVQNSIEASTASTTTSTTPDYFVFAVLNNNTILRKRPPTLPNKDTPFLIVGVYPNNTIVRKFPNGTLVPMEQIIRVRGFDTSQNPIPLPEITSNQVTNDLGSAQDSNDPTVDQNRGAPQAGPNALSLELPAGNSTNNNNNLAPTTVASTTSTRSTVPPSSTRQTTTTTVVPSTSTTLASTTVSSAPSTTFSASTVGLSTNVPSTTTQTPTLPTLSELLNGKRVEAFNNLINQSSSTTKEVPNYKTVQVNKTPSFTAIPSTTVEISTTMTPITSPKLSEISRTPGVTSSTTLRTTTTAVPSTTTAEPYLSNRILEYTGPIQTTVKIPTTSTLPTTLPTLFPSTTMFPTFLTTLFPNLFKITAAEPPVTTQRVFSRQQIPEEFLVASTTSRATTVVPSSTTKEITTTERSTTTTQRTTTTTSATTTRRIRTTTTTTEPTTRRARTRTTTMEPSTTTTEILTTRMATTEETIPPTVTGRSAQTEPMQEFKKATKLKELTEEQRMNLEAIARLEKEQEALLKQLSFLTSLNFGGNNARKLPPIRQPPQINNSLANRIIAMAVERDRNRSTPKQPNSIQDQLDLIAGNTNQQREPKKINPSLEEVLKQYNVSDIEVPKDPDHGKSEDALLAAILKEQGIGPTTPKALGDRIKESGIFDDSTTTTKPKPKPRPRPRPTTQRPPGGRLMQGLNWLLNVLAPPPTTTRRPKVKKPSVEPELLTHQPTRITPVVTAAPKVAPGVKSLSQEDIKFLINQLEEVQKNPKKASEVDFSKIKSLQNLIDVNEGVEVFSAGQHGATAKATTRTPITTTTSRSTEETVLQTRRAKSTTAIPIASTSNSLEDDFDFTKPVATRPVATRPPFVPSLPPLRLNPVAGVDSESGEPLIRSNLITAAVNVTRAISSFLGSALQGAAQGFRGLIGAGSSMVGNFAQGSSLSGNSPG